MNCQEIQDQLPEYVDRLLKQSVVAGIEEHLRACQDCTQVLTLYRENVELLGSFPEVDPPAHLAPRIFERTVRGARVVRLFDRFFGIPAPALLSAAAALLIIALAPPFLRMDTAPSRAANKYVHRAWSYTMKMYGRAEGVGQEIATFKNVFVLILDRRVDQIQDELESYSNRKQKNDQQSSQRGYLASEGSRANREGASHHVLRQS